MHKLSQQFLKKIFHIQMTHDRSLCKDSRFLIPESHLLGSVMTLVLSVESARLAVSCRGGIRGIIIEIEIIGGGKNWLEHHHY